MVRLKTHFKVDMGADGNLLPLAEFFKHFPDANTNELTRTRDPHTKLCAYNQTEIRQSSVCELMVQYQSSKKICDSENLKLVMVHFNSVENET